MAFVAIGARILQQPKRRGFSTHVCQPLAESELKVEKIPSLAEGNRRPGSTPPFAVFPSEIDASSPPETTPAATTSPSALFLVRDLLASACASLLSTSRVVGSVDVEPAPPALEDSHLLLIWRAWRGAVLRTLRVIACMVSLLLPRPRWTASWGLGKGGREWGAKGGGCVDD